MKNILLIFLLVTLGGTNQKKQKLDKSHTYNYSESLKFSIQKISKSRTSNRGNVTYVSKKGTRFISFIFKFENKSNNEQTIDFEKIFLYDKNLNLINIDYVVKAMKLTGRFNRFHQKLKPNKKGTFFIEFAASIPKNDPIKTLNVNGQIIDIIYK
ncbi:hypothetical protein [Olleya sp. YS]|uniref:hypothetical protein n=1 Tax=Olleya sp. YS TaxID=3028318 RepID=UPI00243426B9|nr:hypothetical protein [Olleya sp. YS]WGD34012.1 hypothetical protein Ollyesu_09490 [Olleya sp. YS]